MNLIQRIITLTGGTLIALRLLYPYSNIKFKHLLDPTTAIIDSMQQLKLKAIIAGTTQVAVITALEHIILLQAIGVAVLTYALVVCFSKRNK